MAKYTKAAVSQRRDQFLSSWRKFAPDVTFAGITLAEFEEDSKKPLDVRKDMADAATTLKGLMLKRDKADAALNEEIILIAHAIRGTPEFGEDCEFYRSLGFIPKSERKKNTKGRKKAAPDAADTDLPDANAA